MITTSLKLAKKVSQEVEGGKLLRLLFGAGLDPACNASIEVLLRGQIHELQADRGEFMTRLKVAVLERVVIELEGSNADALPVPPVLTVDLLVPVRVKRAPTKK